MSFALILCAGVIFLCIVAEKVSAKIGVPALLLFIAVGMLFGTDGILKIPFDNYFISEKICSIALIFIMFYGGFCTKWDIAKPVATKAVLLSSVGVIITALLTTVFCFGVLKFTLIKSFIIGAVISSTDAASVFSILRSKNLNLKYGTASLLEIESGSNDPVAYMLTMIGLMLLNGDRSESIIGVIFSQVLYAVLFGVVIAFIGRFILSRKKLIPKGSETIFMIGISIMGYAIPELVGGNGFLSVYLLGIILGNSNIKNKKELVHFFDSITSLAQILIFFLLGLLAFPHKIVGIFFIAIAIAIFLILVARPIAVFILLKPFRCTNKQCLFISLAGLRGAASIVFAIMVISRSNSIGFDLFHIVFLIALLSVAIQGALLPYLSRKLELVDENNDVRKTFNDYQEESDISLVRVFIPTGHNWENKTVSKANLPVDSLAIMIKRDGDNIVPKGDTVILANDSVILGIPKYRDGEEINLRELIIEKGNKWIDKSIEELNLPENILIAMIKRGEKSIIPFGKTVIREGDIVVIYE